MQAADGSHDALTQVSAHRSWAIVLRRIGHTETATRLILDTATSLQPELRRGAKYLAACGPLLSTAAYTAVVDGYRESARTLTIEASHPGARLGHECPGFVAGFGPGTVALYRYWHDVARAFHQWGKPEQCYRALRAAEQATPTKSATANPSKRSPQTCCNSHRL